MANRNVEDTKWAGAVRDEDLKELEDLLGELQSSAGKASDDGHIFMLQQYIRLVSLIEPEIHRIRKRFQRETLANLRREHKEHKLNARTSSQ